MPQLRRALRAVLLSVAVAATILVPAAASQGGCKSLYIFPRFMIRTPGDAAVHQVVRLIARRQFRDAERLVKLLTVPQAIWLTGGTPAEVAEVVRKTLLQAKLQRRMPVFVPYNIPGRDCGGYSAGGAQ